MDQDLTQQSYNETMEENRVRVSRLNSRIDTHRNLGCKIDITRWNFVKHNGVALRLEGVLISTMRYKYLNIYPEGRYECAECSEMHAMDWEKPCHMSAAHGMIICPECADTTMDRHLVTSLTHVDEFDMKTDGTDPVIVDLCLSEEDLVIMEEEKQKTLAGLTENWDVEYIYLNNQRMSDIRGRFLAKRVLHRWRALIRHQVQSRVFKVLYHCADMDMNTAIVLAKSVCV